MVLKKVMLMALLLLLLFPASVFAAEDKPFDFSLYDVLSAEPAGVVTFNVITSADVDLKNMKIYGNWVSYGYNKGGTDLTAILTDGDPTTYVTAGLDHAYKNYRTVYAKFSPDGSTTVDIDSLNISFKSGGNQRDFSIKFYGANGALLKSLSSGGTTVVVNLKGVAGFAITPEASYYVEYYFADFKVNGVVHEPEDPSLYIIKGLTTGVLSNNGFYVKWDAVGGQNLKHYRIVVNGKEYTTTNTSFSFTNVDREIPYSIQVSAVDLLGKEYDSTALEFIFPPPDLIPPGKPVGLHAEPDIYTASLSWTLGSEDDLAGYYVLIDSKPLNSIPLKVSSYQLSGLKPETEYIFTLQAVDVSGNISVESDPLKFSTLSPMEPPADAPILSGVVGNGTASLTWTAVKFAESYNVYQDDEKIIETNATRLNLKKLENGREYSFYVTAENDLGVSPKSNVLSLMPDEKLVPDVEIGFDLVDITNGVSSWFAAYWRILAFCIAIPLSFYIGNRVKGLFAN